MTVDDIKAAAGLSIITMMASSIGVDYMTGDGISHVGQGIIFVAVFAAYIAAIKLGRIKR